MTTPPDEAPTLTPLATLLAAAYEAFQEACQTQAERDAFLAVLAEALHCHVEELLALLAWREPGAAPGQEES